MKHQSHVYWTTRDPWDPCADWRPWLALRAGEERWAWTWWYHDVVAGSEDERTVITVAFALEAHQAAWLLECLPEVFHRDRYYS